MSDDRYEVLIANWNGDGVIERCLDSVASAIAMADAKIEVTAIDDASTDGSPATIDAHEAVARFIQLERNAGYGAAVNHAMGELGARWVFLLNNDLAVAPDYFARLIEAKQEVEEDEPFAIGARTIEWGGGAPNHGGMRARWRRGSIVQEGFDCDALAPADFFQAGACLIDREKFLELGGFAGLFAPGYWEDYDLAYQGRRRGWRNYYEPRATAEHWGKHSMTARLGRAGVERTIRRNHLLFNWINLSDGGLLARHLIGLGGVALRGPEPPDAKGAGGAAALAAALGRLPQALAARRRRPRTTAVGDREILFPNGSATASEPPPRD